jgi:hypothetical protein
VLATGLILRNVLAGFVQADGLSQTSLRLSRSSYWYLVTCPLPSIRTSRLPTPSYWDSVTSCAPLPDGAGALA